MDDSNESRPHENTGRKPIEVQSTISEQLQGLLAATRERLVARGASDEHITAALKEDRELYYGFGRLGDNRAESDVEFAFGAQAEVVHWDR